MERNYSHRLETIDEYIELGKKLEDIVREGPELEALEISLEMLGDIRINYEKSMENEEERRKIVEEYGDEEYESKSTIREGYIAKLQSIRYGAMGLLTAPFSPELSKTYLQISAVHKKEAELHFEINELKKKNADCKKKYAEIQRGLEYGEAKLADELKKAGYPQKRIDHIIDRQEILFFDVIDQVKSKNANWL